MTSLRFTWDPAKDARTQELRGFGFGYSALIFDGETIEWEDDRRDYGEPRVRAIGVVDGVVLHVVFTDRDGVRRIISARIANKLERQRWIASR